MEHPWRPRPPPPTTTANICPVCSNQHFPFCPPPLPQYLRRPPPPPPDHFFHTPPPPPPPYVDRPTTNPYPPPPPAAAAAPIPPRPLTGNPNNYYVNNYSNHGEDYDGSGHAVGVKRMRLNNGNEGYAGYLGEDERRLKLIRDHGAMGRSYDGGYRVSNTSFEQSRKGNVIGDHVQGIEDGRIRDMNSYGERQFTHRNIENNKNLELGRSQFDQNKSNVVGNHGYGNGVYGADGYNNFKGSSGSHEVMRYGTATYQEQRRDFPTEKMEFKNQFLQSPAAQHHAVESNKPTYYGLPNQSENVRHVQEPKAFVVQPPLPTSPPPPLPAEPLRFHFSESAAVSSSASNFQSPYTMVSESIPPVLTHYTSRNPHASGYFPEEIQSVKMTSSRTFRGESQEFPPRHLGLDKPKVIDASQIFKHPHRASRPDHIVIILRGLSGSGKSYLAKLLRDLEVENGGTAPRIHSMDEYFMTEVEKVEESEGSRSSGSVRGKKPVTKKVMEYCYEPEMEEAYRSSMLKAFKKTLDEGAFPFVIVDDRNLRVADFAQFWATAKRSGYEVYLLEATYKDPAGCAARNVHGFTQNDIHNMANQWEEAPSLYMKLDIKPILHGDDMEENGIQEVDMDTEDGDPSGSEDTNVDKATRPSEGLSKDGLKKGAAEEHQVEAVKELGKSKWSDDLDEDDVHKSEATRGNSSGALSSLIKSYSKKGKSVRWSDQIGRIGFSIGAGKAANASLVIGPGLGYNLKSNPLPEEEKVTQRSGESKKRNIFQDQLRAEHESFRAVFDKRKQRIGGLDVDAE